MLFISLQGIFRFQKNQILEFQIFKFYDVIKYLSIKQEMHFKPSLLMKFGHFMSYSKRNDFNKKFYKNSNLKTRSRPFCICKELSSTYLYQIRNSKAIGISPNQHPDLLRFLFTEDSLKIKKDIISRLYFAHNFLIKTLILQYYKN